MCVCARGVCRAPCVWFAQRASGWRALRWLVKRPSRALGFELAFCQSSCQKEAGNIQNVCVCVYVCVPKYVPAAPPLRGLIIVSDPET